MKKEKMDFYKMLLVERKQSLPVLETNAADKIKDRQGSCTSSLALSFRFIGITEYLISQDLLSFRSNLAKSAALRLSLFRRFESGEEIDTSYVAMLAYKELFDALASSTFQIALDLARLMGGRPEIEKKHDHPFDCAMGYALRAVVLSETQSSSPLEELKGILQKEENRDFRGYGIVLNGIVMKNEAEVNRGLAMVADGHSKQSKSGVFEGTDDEDLCVWGIGLANLAKSGGLEARVTNPLIPTSLML